MYMNVVCSKEIASVASAAIRTILNTYIEQKKKLLLLYADMLLRDSQKTYQFGIIVGTVICKSE